MLVVTLTSSRAETVLKIGQTSDVNKEKLTTNNAKVGN